MARLIQFCLGTAIIAAAAAAQNSAPSNEVKTAPSLPTLLPGELGYSVTHWTVEEGLPGRIMTSLAQTPDGYLWCGGPEGVVRYDGLRFTVFHPEEVQALRDVQVLELRCDSFGRLWIEGIEGQLVVYEQGRFRRLLEKDGIPPGEAGKLGEVQEGDFWVKGRTDDRFYRYGGDRFEAVFYPGMPSSHVDRFMAGPAGVQWGVHESDRTMIRFSGAEPDVQRLVAPDGQSLVRAGRLFRLRNGRPGVTSSHGIYGLADSRWNMLRGFPDPLLNTESNAILDGVQDEQGNFWISVFGKGLVLSQPDGRTSLVPLPNLSTRPFIRALLFGAEENIWVAGNDGLYRLRRNAFLRQPGSLAETNSAAAVGFVEDSEGAMWILHEKGWTRHTKTGWRFEGHPYSRALLRAGCASRGGSVVLGYLAGPSAGMGHVDKLLPDGQTERLGSLAGIPLVILESHAGELWVGADPGLWRWQDGRFTRIVLPQIPGDYAVHGLAEDRDGRILVAAYRHGLYRKEGMDWWRPLTSASDEGSDGIWGIDLDDEGTVWAATVSGLARWREGEWHSYAAMRSELPRLARSVVCDDSGGLWVSSQFGVGRVERSALAALAAGQEETLGSDWFDRSDGLPSVYCGDQQGALYEAADGRIWVGTFRGAAVVDPEEWRTRRERLSPPSVQVEEVMVDNTPVVRPLPQSRQSVAAPIVIPPGAHRLEIRYTAINLTASRKSRFRYRLEGADQGWSDAGEQRTAVYYRLPPGNYRFQVSAANKYGLWNSAGASVAFLVQPHWWQTLPFRIGAGALLLGLLWFSRSIKLRQLHRERTRRDEFARRLIESQETERKRIAGELHDSMGQDLILIKNAANLTLRKFTPDPPVQERLSEMADLASHALSNARAITSNLRPPELDRLGLTAALEAMLDKHAEHSGIQFVSTIDNVDGLWPPEQEINVYRVVQESLNNALKHAGPRRIEVEVKRLEAEVKMTVIDDGCGFDTEASLASGRRLGMGLTGLEERVRILGGEMELTSARGAGTSLRYRIPVPGHGKI